MLKILFVTWSFPPPHNNHQRHFSISVCISLPLAICGYTVVYIVHYCPFGSFKLSAVFRITNKVVTILSHFLKLYNEKFQSYLKVEIPVCLSPIINNYQHFACLVSSVPPLSILFISLKYFENKSQTSFHP